MRIAIFPKMGLEMGLTCRCDRGHRTPYAKKLNIAFYSCVMNSMLGKPKLEWSLKMNRIIKMLTIATAFAVVLSLSLPAHAQSADLFKSKCAMCHGPDGTGSKAGKAMGAHDFTTADVQKMSDAELAEVITNGKGKMKPSTGLKPEDVKGLVAYIRTLKK